MKRVEMARYLHIKYAFLTVTNFQVLNLYVCCLVRLHAYLYVKA